MPHHIIDDVFRQVIRAVPQRIILLACVIAHQAGAAAQRDHLPGDPNPDQIDAVEAIAQESLDLIDGGDQGLALRLS